VRGTIFLTSVQDDPEKGKSTQFAVLQGSVAVQKQGESEEYILTEETELEIVKQRKMSKDMIRPLSAESVKHIRKLSVFHRTNVGEYNTLVDEIKSSIPEFSQLESTSTMEESLERRSASEARVAKERVKEADRADLNRYIKRDTEGDPLKLEADSGYKK
jgi:hypothetical protein